MRPSAGFSTIPRRLQPAYCRVLRASARRIRGLLLLPSQISAQRSRYSPDAENRTGSTTSWPNATLIAVEYNSRRFLSDNGICDRRSHRKHCLWHSCQTVRNVKISVKSSMIAANVDNVAASKASPLSNITPRHNQKQAEQAIDCKRRRLYWDCVLPADGRDVRPVTGISRNFWTEMDQCGRTNRGAVLLGCPVLGTDCLTDDLFASPKSRSRSCHHHSVPRVGHPCRTRGWNGRRWRLGR